MRTRIVVWTVEQCRAVAKAYLDLTTEFENVAAGRRRAAQLRAAMERSLPRKLWRDSNKMFAIWATVKPYVEDATYVPGKKVTVCPPKAVEVAPVPEPVPEAAPPPRSVVGMEHDIQNLFQPFAEGLAKAISWQIAQTLDNVVRNVVLPILQEEVRKLVPAQKDDGNMTVDEFEVALEQALSRHEPTAVVVQATTPVPEEVSTVKLAPRDRLPRVVVIGLLRQQVHDVEREFQGCIEFTFMPAAATLHPAEFQSKLVGNDLIILMTRFISHWHDEQAKKSEVPIMRITGSVSMLKSWLQKWFNGEIGLAGMPAHDHRKEEE